MAMRDVYKQIFKKFFTQNLIQKRDQLDITQEQAASLLHMTHRAYSNLEHEECGCNGLTLALYLIYMDSNPIEFLNELKELLEQESTDEKEAL